MTFTTALSFVGDLEKEKSRLQSILATGKDESKAKPRPSLSEAQSPEPLEKDRFQEGKPLRENNSPAFTTWSLTPTPDPVMGWQSEMKVYLNYTVNITQAPSNRMVYQ